MKIGFEPRFTSAPEEGGKRGDGSHRPQKRAKKKVVEVGTDRAVPGGVAAKEYLSVGDEGKGARTLRGAIFGTKDNGSLEGGKISWPADWKRLGRQLPKGFKDVDVARRFERSTITRMLQTGGEKTFAAVFDAYAITIANDFHRMVPQLRQDMALLREKAGEAKETGLKKEFFETIPLAEQVLATFEKVTAPFAEHLQAMDALVKGTSSADLRKDPIFFGQDQKPTLATRQMIEFWLWARFNHLIPTTNADRRADQQIKRQDKKPENSDALWMESTKQFVFGVLSLSQWERQRRGVQARNTKAEAGGTDRVSAETGETIILAQAEEVPRSWLSDILTQPTKNQRAITYMGAEDIQVALSRLLKVQIAPLSPKQAKREAEKLLGDVNKTRAREQKAAQPEEQRSPEIVEMIRTLNQIGEELRQMRRQFERDSVESALLTTAIDRVRIAKIHVREQETGALENAQALINRINAGDLAE